MKKILIALDFDSSAEKVAKIGFKIAKAMNAQVLLFHAVDEPLYYSLPLNIMGYDNTDTAAYIDSPGALAKKSRNFLAAIAADLGDDNIKTVVTEGDTAETILAFAAKEKADMIVMGSHRFRGLERMLFSTNASDVIKNSKIPLLTVPVAA